MSTIVDIINKYIIFHSTWFYLPLSMAYNWLYTSLRYAACLLICLGLLFTCGYLGAITIDRRVLDALSAVIAK